MTDTDVRWDAPGPGPWELESAHFGRPMPAFERRALLAGFVNGFSKGAARFGLLLEGFTPGLVNGFFYMQAKPFGAPEGSAGKPPPPGFVLWLLTRLHPAMRKRIAESKAAFDGCIWREDLRRWDEEDKPRAMKRHHELLGVDPIGLDDAALADHLAAAEAHLADMITLHHVYTIPCILPVGDLMANVSRWTGKAPGEILQALRGSTPASLGLSAAELNDLASAITAGGRQALLDGDDAGVIERLKHDDGAVGDAARKLFDLVWYRALSYSVDERVTGELPAVLAGAVRAAVTRKHQARSEGGADRVKPLRDAVPAEHRTRFDELLGEARAINRLRDERGLYADCLAVGIARRALLEAGKRLTERGKLHRADDAVDLLPDEARELLTGAGGPTRDAVRKLAEWRETKTVEDAPKFLGGEPPPPPPASLLPAAAQRAALAVDMVLSNLLKDSDRSSEGKVVRGLSVNEGVYEGTARLVRNASEFDRLQQGDVLVTVATAPYFNVVLPLLGALVTDRGGQLCHAAIVAREYGIPGVVGTKEATKLIPDGARVRVDGTKGEVHVL